MMKLLFISCLVLSNGLRWLGNDGDDEKGQTEEDLPHARLCHASTDFPTLCPQGNDKWSLEELKASVPEFAKTVKNNPIKNQNKGGGNANHQFALWFTVKQLKPKYIIESGIFKRASTWLMRQAAPEAKMISLDPVDEYIVHRDNNTQYFVGKNFKDFADMDWDSLIPKDERKNTLVMLDDHMNAIKRTKQVLKLGFAHVWYDDNWNARYPKNDCYSFNTLCAPLTSNVFKESFVHMRDVFGTKDERITFEEHRKNSEWLSSRIKTYFEFPAIWDECGAKKHYFHNRSQMIFDGGNSTLYLKFPEELSAMGFPLPGNKNHYSTLYPPYVELQGTVDDQ